MKMDSDKYVWHELLTMGLISSDKQRVQYKGQKLKPHLTRLVADGAEHRKSLVMPDTVVISVKVPEHVPTRIRSLVEELEDTRIDMLNNYKLVNRNKVIEYKGSKFLLMEWPPHKIGGIEAFVELMSTSGVRVLVKTCDIEYSERYSFLFMANFIRIVEILFRENGVPSRKQLEEWLSLCRMYAEIGGSAVAVHCVNGFGRSPFLVALSLIELGMKSEEAISQLRLKRNQAISKEQEAFLHKYRPKRWGKSQACRIF